MSTTSPVVRRSRSIISRESSAELGRALRRLRLARGMTQSDVAGNELTKALISQVELGHTRPSAETLDLVARRLGTSADALLASLAGTDGRVPQRGDVSYALRRAEALLSTSRHDEAERQLSALGALELPSLHAAIATRLRSELHLRRGQYTEAAAAAVEAVALAEKARSITELVLANNDAGRAHYQAERFPAALQYFEVAMTSAVGLEVSDPQLLARLYANRGNALWRLGEAGRAREDFEASLRWSEAAEDLFHLGLAHMGLGEMARERGDLLGAVQHIERAIAVFERAEERTLHIQNLHNLGETTAALGDATTARGLHERAHKAATAMNDGRTAGYALERLAVLDLEDGDHATAMRRAEAAVAAARESSDTHLLSQALATLGDVRDARGDRRAADRAYAQSVESGRRDGAYSLRRALLRRGTLERRRGDHEAAAATFESAATLTPGS